MRLLRRANEIRCRYFRSPPAFPRGKKKILDNAAAICKTSRSGNQPPGRKHQRRHKDESAGVGNSCRAGCHVVWDRQPLLAIYFSAGDRTGLSASIDGGAGIVNSYTFDKLHRLTRVDQTGQAGRRVVGAGGCHEKPDGYGPSPLGGRGSPRHRSRSCEAGRHRGDSLCVHGFRPGRLG